LGEAKRITLRAIPATEANALVKRVHYSGKIVQNSQLHIGVFYDGRLEGAMQFGPSLDKRKIQGLVEGTPWNGFIELNRMAFSEALPRNSESRAIGIAMRMLRKHASHLQWVVTFADGAQCGDGTIYRAAGFVLTGIKRNTQIWEAKTGDRFSRTSLTDGRSKQQQANRLCRVSATKGSNILTTGGASMSSFKAAGFVPIPGHQLRYLYFLDPTARQRLTVPVLPFSEIARRGAEMYRGTKRAGSIASDAPANHAGQGGATPTPALSTAGNEASTEG
jgi:hypothetical protein